MLVGLDKAGLAGDPEIRGDRIGIAVDSPGEILDRQFAFAGHRLEQPLPGRCEDAPQKIKICEGDLSLTGLSPKRCGRPVFGLIQIAAADGDPMLGCIGVHDVPSNWSGALHRSRRGCAMSQFASMISSKTDGNPLRLGQMPSSG